MTDRRRWSRSAPASGHDVHPDLDWYLTIAQPCTAKVQTPNTGYRAKQMFVSISKLCIFLLFMSDRLCRSRSAPTSGHDVHCPDLDPDWYLRIAQSCTATGFGLCNVVQVMSSSCRFQNVPVPVPRPGANGGSFTARERGISVGRILN